MIVLFEYVTYCVCNVVLMQRSTPTNEAIDRKNNQPHIVMLSDDDDITPSVYIAVEQELVVECADLLKALFMLLAVHYVFDISYNERVKDFFLFLQEKVMNISDEAYSSGRSGKKISLLLIYYCHRVLQVRVAT